jgi:hypothetical protein
MTDQNETPAQPAPQAPNIERGKVYESLGPNGENIVLMTNETWVDFGTNVESIRQIARNRDRLLHEEKGKTASLEIQLADARRRLENLRAIRRQEKRPEVERAVNELYATPGDNNA